MSENALRVKFPGEERAESFELASVEGQRRVSVSSRPWQPGDKRQMFRVPLGPWDGGLYVDRLATPSTYAKANADATNNGMLLHPPKVNTISFANGSSTVKMLEFAGNIFVLRGRYIYRIDPSDYSTTQDRDFGSGNAGVDMEVFNNELIVAMGASTRIWRRSSTGTWAQATDNTFAIALGVVGTKLWRAESPNEISSCTTTPLTLANWVPADPNQYLAGDSSYPVNKVIEYGGIPWMGKPNGMFAPDPRTEFLNQTPQLRSWPDTANCVGAFTALGYLWVPSAPSLLRIQPGASRASGPEGTYRPDYRFRVKNGVEWDGGIFLLVNDATTGSQPFIARMIRDVREQTPNEYIFHEWARLGSGAGNSILISTLPTNPTLFADTGSTVQYIKLGRGGGRSIDDSNYEFGTSMELETGLISPVSDRGIVVQPVGVEVTLDYSGADESLTLSGRVDSETYVELLSNQGRGGTAPIQRTDGIESVRRYWPEGTKCQHLEVKFESSLASASGTDRPEIYEASCFGFIHPKQVTVSRVAIEASRYPGRYRSSNELLETFLQHHDLGTEVEIALPGGMKMNAVVTGVESYQQNATVGPDGFGTEAIDAVEVEFTEAIHAHDNWGEV